MESQNIPNWHKIREYCREIDKLVNDVIGNQYNELSAVDKIDDYAGNMLGTLRVISLNIVE